jgi:hypothetical protein
MSFDFSRLRRADQIIGAGAIALFVFLFFFKWYGVSISSPIGGVSVGTSANGWHSFTDSRWIWLLTIIVALGAVALVASQRALSVPVQPSVIVAGLGALSVILILYRILHHPTASASFGATHASAGIKIGIWLGLIAAAAIAYGGYLAMQAEGTSLADVREQASGAFTDVTAPASGASPAASTGSAGSTGGSVPVPPSPVPPPAPPPQTPPPATPPPPPTPQPPAPAPPTPAPAPTPPTPTPPTPTPPTPAPSPAPPIPPPAGPPGEGAPGGTPSPSHDI